MTNGATSVMIFCHRAEELLIFAYLMFTYARQYASKSAIAPNVYLELMRQRIAPGLSVIRSWFNGVG